MHVSNLCQLRSAAAAAIGVPAGLASLQLQDERGALMGAGAAGFGASLAATSAGSWYALTSTTFPRGTSEAVRAGVTGTMTARGTAIGCAAALGAVALGYFAETGPAKAV